MSAPDTRQPIFDPGLDVATVVFSHVQCVKTRQASPWSASCGGRPPSLPLRTLSSSTSARSRTCHLGRRVLSIIGLLDNDEALSLPYERVVRLLGEAATGKTYATTLLACGSVRLLKWTREHNLCLECGHVPSRSPIMDTCPLSSTCTRTGALGDMYTCWYAAQTNTGTACSTRWITSARGGRIRREIREAPQMNTSYILVTTRVPHVRPTQLSSKPAPLVTAYRTFSRIVADFL